jgi:hypothetical protein
MPLLAVVAVALLALRLGLRVVTLLKERAADKPGAGGAGSGGQVRDAARGPPCLAASAGL